MVTATAVAATRPQTTDQPPIHPPTQPCRPKISFHSPFHLLPLTVLRPLYELSGPKLWPDREPVNCRQRRRESAGGRLPVTSTGPFRENLRQTSGCYRRLHQGLRCRSRSSFFASGEDYYAWNRAFADHPSTYGQFVRDLLRLL